jgi:hypothetical protein
LTLWPISTSPLSLCRLITGSAVPVSHHGIGCPCVVSSRDRLSLCRLITGSAVPVSSHHGIGCPCAPSRDRLSPCPITGSVVPVPHHGIGCPCAPSRDRLSLCPITGSAVPVPHHGIGEVNISTCMSLFGVVCAISPGAANRTSGTAAPAGTRFVPGFRRYNDGNQEQITSPGAQTRHPGHPALDGRVTDVPEIRISSTK